MSLLEVLTPRGVVLSVGPGGVGKTTTAAALGLAAAQSGRSTLVCTIDPARRLAASLGLSGLGDEPTRVAATSRAGGSEGAPLWAMMLDAEQTLDRMLLQSVTDPDHRARLGRHPLYRVMARDLPGMYEYAAVARLHELHATGRWSLIVLDTPPTAHALDFLDAPMRLLRAMQSPVVSWLVRPYLRAGSLSLKKVSGARSYVLRRIAQIVGPALLERMAEFLVLFDAVLDDIRARVEAVRRLLASEQTGAVVVTAPTSTTVVEAERVLEALGRRRIRVDGLVFNRAHEQHLDAAVSAEQVAEWLAAEPAVAARPAEEQLALLEELLASHERTRRLSRADRRYEQRLLQVLPDPAPAVVRVPLLDDDVHDIGGLKRVAAYLRSAASPR